MGSLLSPGLDAITIFLHGLPTPPIAHPQTITIKHGAAVEEILQFVRARGGGGSHLPLSPQLICHVKYHDVLMEVRFRR